MTRDDAYFIKKAYDQALKAFKNNEVPIGAVIVDSRGDIVAYGYNQVEKLQNQVAHAEISVIKKISKN